MLYNAGIFVGGLVLVSLAGLVLSTSLERIGVRFGFTQALLGIVTALGADSPEISSAITALHGGNAVLGVGVVFGSNLFNLASLLGLSAVTAGFVRIAPKAAIFNGTVSLCLTVGAALIVLSVAPAWVGAALLAFVFVPYVVLCALGSDRLGLLAPLPRIQAFLRDALSEQHADEPSDRGSTKAATTFDMLAAVPALVTIVLGSVGMVRGGQALGKHFGISDIIIGTIVLAALTGVPNAIAAIRLAHKQQGAAVISEAFNSNTLNIAVGIFLPALVVGLGASQAAARLSIYWLIALTAAAVILALRKCGLRRNEGFALIAAYAAFVALLVTFSAG